MPVPPPVMTAIFPAKSFMGGWLTFPVLIFVIWSEREDLNLRPKTSQTLKLASHVCLRLVHKPNGNSNTFFFLCFREGAAGFAIQS
jgi:hypothetical protein